MSDDTIFRERIIEPVEGDSTVEVPTKNTIDGEIDGEKLREPDAPEQERDELQEWEDSNGKYGAKFFGVQEILKTFPMKIHFGAVDSFIKEQITEKGWSRNTENYQKILNDIEKEIGSSRLETFSRMKKIYDYIQVVKKMNELKKKKESFSIKAE